MPAAVEGRFCSSKRYAALYAAWTSGEFCLGSVVVIPLPLSWACVIKGFTVKLMLSSSFLMGVLLFEVQAISFVGFAVLLFEFLVWPAPKNCNPPGVFHAFIQVWRLWEMSASVFHLRIAMVVDAV